MADSTVNASAVLASPNAVIGRGTAGVTISAGQPLYFDPTAGTYKLCNASGVSPAFKCVGVSLHEAYAGQPIAFAVNDPQFTPGFDIAQGDVIIVSGHAAGGVAPVGDKASGWYVTVLGVGIGNNQMNLNLTAAGQPVPYGS